MEKNKAKKNMRPVAIKKPFLKGKPWDCLSLKTVLGLMGAFLLLMIAFLLLGSLLLIDQPLLRIAVNLCLVLGSYMIFFSFGGTSGTQAVSQGEILYNRKESGRPMTAKELACCYHPLKGFVCAITALLPFLLAAIAFACIARRQMVTMGGLPSWVSGLAGHSEITDPIAYYSTTVALDLEDILRIFIRMNIMPWVNIFDSANMDNMLLMERLSPVLMLLPALSYGVGYTFGPSSRARVHGDIALGRKKAAKKARRDHKRKVAARTPHEPQRLN